MVRPPKKQGLYDPANEHDACGVGFVANIKGEKSNEIIRDGLLMLANLDHRGAKGADPLVGDGAGCLIQIPDELLRSWAQDNAEEHTSELQSLAYLVCRLLLEKKKKT